MQKCFANWVLEDEREIVNKDLEERGRSAWEPCADLGRKGMWNVVLGESRRYQITKPGLLSVNGGQPF